MDRKRRGEGQGDQVECTCKTHCTPYTDDDDDDDDNDNLLGKKILFVTNNSTKSRKAYLEKFKQLDIHADEEEIFGSAFATAYYMKSILGLPEDKKVYVISEGGICDELTEEGIKFFGGPSEKPSSFPPTWAEVEDIHPDPSVGAVVMGFDMAINYRKLSRAHVYLTTNPECHFIATNTDSTFPHAGRKFPGTGAMVASIRESTGREPKVIGKPEQTMMDCIIQSHHFDRSRTCMVGDRLNTDILFGIQGGLSTLLVLSGITTKDEAFREDQTIKSEYWANSFGDLSKASEH